MRTHVEIGLSFIMTAGLILGCGGSDGGDAPEDTLTQTDSESSQPSTDSQDTETGDSDTGSVSDTGSDTGSVSDTGSDTGSVSDTGSDTGSVSDTGSDTGSESETATESETVDETDTFPDTTTEIFMSITEVVPPAASRNEETTLTVLGFAIEEGATLKLVNCDSGIEYDLTDQATVAEDGTSISATLPADAAREQGLYTVIVTNPDGSTDRLECAFRVLAGVPPTVTSVSPTSAFNGIAGDGISSDLVVNILGTGFASTPSVQFVAVTGGATYESPLVGFISDTSLTATVPSESKKMEAGEYHVYVINPNQLSGQWLVEGEPGIFTVTTSAPPIIDDVQPQRVPQNECTTTTLTITGTGFSADATVWYQAPADNACADGYLDDNNYMRCPVALDTAAETEITAHFPTCPPLGNWPITVVNPDEQYDTFFSVLVSNSSDGHLNEGDWVTMDSAMLAPRFKHTAEYGFDAFGNAFLYVAGGQDADGQVLDTVEISQFDIFGSPGPFAEGLQYENADNPRVYNRMVLARQGAAMVRVGKELFLMGGAQQRTDVTAEVSATNSVERARILGYEEVPTMQWPSAAGTDGLPKGSWYYRVSALGPWGEGLASTQVVAKNVGGEITICWNAPFTTGATGYNIYRSPAADGRIGTEILLAAEQNEKELCFVDDGQELLAPAPAKVRAAPAAGAGFLAGTYTYAVSALVTLADSSVFETPVGYATEVTVTDEDVTGGAAAIQVNWDPVPIDGVAYNLYRVSAGTGELALVDTGGPLTETGFLDTGAALDAETMPIEGIAPLAQGSLSKWTELPVEQFMAAEREGAEAVVVAMDAETQDDVIARIIVAGGRTDNTGADLTYLTTAESLGVRADGSLETTWHSEDCQFNYPRAFYALVSTQDREVNDYPDDPEDPPCGDKDGDGYIDCVCAPEGTVADCDDSNPNVNPGEEEICGDGIDQDCDAGCAGGVDVPCEYTCEDDLDGDGYISIECGGIDCCDSGDEGGLGCAVETAADIHPGAKDPCDDGIDQDCDGIDPECTCTDDLDGDGFISIECGGIDCCDSGADTSLGCTDETASWIYPGAKEWCQNGVDENCDGVDDRCIPSVPSMSTSRILPPPSGGEPVYLVAVLGQSEYDPLATNVGRTDFEAILVGEDGHLVCDNNNRWTLQGISVENPRANFGHDALLYSTYLYPFTGVKKESLNPISRELATASISRFVVTPPSEVAGNDLLSGNQNGSTEFDTYRGYYKMTRLMSFIYVIGGWTDEGPTGTLERHNQ